MKNLKNKLLFILFLNFSCASKQSFIIKSFHTETSSEELHTVKVNSSRIQQKCSFLNAEDENKWRHQYTMYILNDQNEIIEILHPIHQDKNSCLSQIKEISKIIKEEKTVDLCLRGNLKKDLNTNEIYEFHVSEKYPIIYSFLTFDSICSSKKCYSINEAWKETCPGFKKN